MRRCSTPVSSPTCRSRWRPSDARWRWRVSCARSASELADGATAEEVLWVLWAGTSLARAPACGHAARRGRRPAGPPRPRRRVRAVRRRRPGRGAARAHRRPRPSSHTLRAQQIPADTLAERGVRGDAVRLLTAHRVQGSGVAAGRGRPRAGGRLARPPAPRHAAACRPDRCRRAARRADHHPRAARRGAPALLRRLHPRPRAAGRDGGGVDRRRRRAAVALPDRARSRRRRPSHRPCRRQALPPAVAGRSGRRAPTYDGRPERSPEPLRDAAAARLARLTREHRSGSVRWCRAPTRRPGGAPAAWPAGDQPLRPVDEPVAVSASALTSLDHLPGPVVPRAARPGQSAPATQAQGFGNVVHALADRIGRGDEPITGAPGQRSSTR